MKKLISITLLILTVFATAQSTLYKEESKEVDRIVSLMKNKCTAYQFALEWAENKYKENDPRRQKFEDEIHRKFLSDCKNRDLDEYETKARLNYKL